MSISKLTTEKIEAEINEDLETLLDLKEEIKIIIDVIKLEINEAITNKNQWAEKILDKEWYKHYKLLWEIDDAIMRVSYIIK